MERLALILGVSSRLGKAAALEQTKGGDVWCTPREERESIGSQEAKGGH